MATESKQNLNKSTPSSSEGKTPGSPRKPTKETLDTAEHKDNSIISRKDSPEDTCPPASPPLRRSERNVSSDSLSPKKAANITPKSPELKVRMKRKHPDSEAPLSPPTRKRKLVIESEDSATPPTSPTKHGMCLRKSPKSPLIQTPESSQIQTLTPESSQIQTLTPKSSQNTPKSDTPDTFKTPRKPILIPRIARKRVKLEFKEPDPATFTSLTELFDYDDLISRKSPRISKIPRLPSASLSSDITPLSLICEEKFV